MNQGCMKQVNYEQKSVHNWDPKELNTRLDDITIWKTTYHNVKIFTMKRIFILIKNAADLHPGPMLPSATDGYKFEFKAKSRVLNLDL